MQEDPRPKVVLDHVKNIVLDPVNAPFSNYQAMVQNYMGLKILADAVRQEERKAHKANPPGASVFSFSSSITPIVYCSFNWFSTTLINYLRLVGLVELMNREGWKTDALVDRKNKDLISTHCKRYVTEACPDVVRWRNKVFAHFAATDPFQSDSLGTLELSIMNPITYLTPYYEIGSIQWNTQGSASDLPSWALTKVYEQLRARFWPEMVLRPIADS